MAWRSKAIPDGFVKSPDTALKLHPSSLRRTPTVRLILEIGGLDFKSVPARVPFLRTFYEIVISESLKAQSRLRSCLLTEIGDREAVEGEKGDPEDDHQPDGKCMVHDREGKGLRPGDVEEA